MERNLRFLCVDLIMCHQIETAVSLPRSGQECGNGWSESRNVFKGKLENHVRERGIVEMR